MRELVRPLARGARPMAASPWAATSSPTAASKPASPASAPVKPASVPARAACEHHNGAKLVPASGPACACRRCRVRWDRHGRACSVLSLPLRATLSARSCFCCLASLRLLPRFAPTRCALVTALSWRTCARPRTRRRPAERPQHDAVDQGRWSWHRDDQGAARGCCGVAEERKRMNTASAGSGSSVGACKFVGASHVVLHALP